MAVGARQDSPLVKLLTESASGPSLDIFAMPESLATQIYLRLSHPEESKVFCLLRSHAR
jgi:hypothetical protein